MRFPPLLSASLSQFHNNFQPRHVAIVLAFAGVVLPVSGLHKFYLGQHRWGLVYLMLSWTPIPHVAAAIEAVWFLTQPDGFAGMNVVAGNVAAPNLPNLLVPQLTDGIRQLEQLRVDGLITEYEFEQKRRQFLDRM
jgi:TM2 domain-containing membrane protein YozV